MELYLPSKNVLSHTEKQIKKGWHALPTLVGGERISLFFSPNSFYIDSIFATFHLIYIGEARNIFSRDMSRT